MPSDSPTFASAGMDKFDLGEMLGEGGLSTVFAAHDRGLLREVAVKFIRADDLAAQLRFIEEGQITAQLQHPNIVPIYEIGADANGRVFLAMKRVVGSTLADAIRAAWGRQKGGTNVGLSDAALRRLLEMFLKVCDAVAFAHAKGVIHRDLKPENVMVGEFGEVLVMDWGLAKAIGKPHPDSVAVPNSVPRPRESNAPDTQVASIRGGDRGLTVAGTVIGTPAYMPPEQAIGSADLDVRADVYALGGILYTILTQRLPMRGKTADEQIIEVLEYRLIPPSQRAPGANVPRELEAVVMKAMARRRRDRYADVGELRADIERFLDGRAVGVMDYSRWMLAAKWVQRNRVLAGGIAATLAAILVGSVAVFAVHQRAEWDWQETEFRARLAAADADRIAAEQAAKAEQSARETREAELRAATAEAEQLKLARERDAEAHARHEAEIAVQARQELIAKLKANLGVQVDRLRTLALEEFYRRLREETATGKSVSDFLYSRPAAELDRYIAGFEGLIEVGDLFGKELATDEDLRFLAEMHTLRRRHDDALRTADRLLARNPNNFEALFVRATIFRHLREFQKCADDLSRVIEMVPSAAEAWANRGEARLQMRQYREAIADLDEALRLAPADDRALNSRGVAYERLGDYASAERDYAASIARNPHFYLSFMNRGRCRLITKDFAGAVADFDAAVKLAPHDGGLRYFRGVALMELQRFSEALRDLNEAVRINGNGDVPALAARGRCKAKLGQTTAGRADLHAALAATSNPQLREQLTAWLAEIDG